MARVRIPAPFNTSSPAPTLALSATFTPATSIADAGRTHARKTNINHRFI
jgi:hypothetical protein